MFVGSHRPPPPEELDSQVSDFVDWLNTEREEDAEATGLHPLELAALAHYKVTLKIGFLFFFIFPRTNNYTTTKTIFVPVRLHPPVL